MALRTQTIKDELFDDSLGRGGHEMITVIYCLIKNERFSVLVEAIELAV